MLLKLSVLVLTSAILADSDFTAWQNWKLQHSKSYSKVENEKRFDIFKSNKKFIQNHNIRFNQGKESFKVKLNKFADLSNAEFGQFYLGKVKLSDPILQDEYTCNGNVFTSNGTPSPSTVSYVKGHATNDKVWTTMVKDQGACGSCWSFGAGHAIEGLMCKNGIKDCSNWNGVSTQQMVDCSSYTGVNSDSPFDLSPFNNHACNGGEEANAIRYVGMNNGINEWDDYGYFSGTSGKLGSCEYDESNAITGIVKGCMKTNYGDEGSLVDAVAQMGPMTVGIDAGGNGFRFYESGVYTSTTCSSSRLNHAVGLSGYGVYDDADVTSPIDFWEIKNSWGSDWGDSGYILIARNQGNMCGVASDAVIAVDE